MNVNETDAILHYLEFHLIAFLNSIEPHIQDPQAIGDMYDRAYSILNDFENTFDTQVLIDHIDLLQQNKPL